MKPTTLKPVRFDLMTVGEQLGPTVLDIDDHFIKSMAFALDDYRDWHVGDKSPFGGPVAAPAAILCDLLRLLYTRYDPDRDLGLHQHEEFWIHSPAFVGDALELSGRFVDKFVKRGRGYIVTEAEARVRGSGRLVVRHRAVETTEVEADHPAGTERQETTARRRVRGELPSGRTLMPSLGHDPAVGDALVGPVKMVHQDQMSIYSGAQLFWHSIHTDIAVATGAGLERPVAQGLMAAAYLSEWATGLFGAGWLEGGWMSLTFLAPIYAGDTVSTFAVVTDTKRAGDGVRIEAEAWVQNQDAVKVAVGWFACTIPNGHPSGPAATDTTVESA